MGGSLGVTMSPPGRLILVAIALVSTAFAGCVATDPASDPVDSAVIDPPRGELPLFALPALVDEVRAGGEPVIAITPSGTIFVSSHPGGTHYHPSDDPTHPGAELVTPLSGQSYMWRSTDGGASWSHVGLAGTEFGPRSTGFGVSDPDFTVFADGTICFTDLEALAMSSVSCSVDDGVTWIGNPVASGRPNDRQWLASFGDDLYFTANFFTDHNLLVSSDLGLTWEERGDTLCAGDIVANPRTGAIFAGCGDGVSVSYDGGFTFELRELGVDHTRAMTEPAIDAADNVWMAYADRGENALTTIGSPDDGESWPWVTNVTAHFQAFARDLGLGDGGAGTYVWPWISAGSEGRYAVSWIGSYDTGNSQEMDTDWFIFSAYVLDATDDVSGPVVVVTQVTPDPIHRGPICQSGTTCQIRSMQGDDSGDRRLGDFFETTIGADGYLWLTYSNTLDRPDDVISHAAFTKQTAGPRLLLEGDAFPTQG